MTVIGNEGMLCIDCGAPYASMYETALAEPLYLCVSCTVDRDFCPECGEPGLHAAFPTCDVCQLAVNYISERETS